MANQIIIDIGAVANDGTGDPLRTAFGYVNNNFSNVWATGVANSNIQFDGNRILTTNVNGNLVLAPNGIGKVQANVDIVPNANNTLSLGSLTRKWNTVYAQNLDIGGNTTFGDLTVSNLTVDGNLTVQGNTIQIGNIVTDTKTIQLANTASTANAANGSGITVGASDNIATLLYNSTSNVWTTNIGITATGNITGTYFVGNGSQLTGITSYGNANVAAYLPTYTGNLAGGNLTVSSAGNTWTIANQYLTGPGGAYWHSHPEQSTDDFVSAPGSDLRLQSIDANSVVESQINLTSTEIELVVVNGVTKTWRFNESGISEIPGDITPVTAGGSPANIGNVSNPWSAAYVSGNVSAGNISLTGQISSNLIPVGNNVQSLGNSTNYWANLWVANNTIYIGGVALGMTAGNVLTVNGNAVLQNNSNSTISTTGNITAGNISTGVITLTNGAVIKDNAGDSVAFGQSAGGTSQGNSAVALGQNAGATDQGTFAVAIGRNAGQTTQGGTAIAIGAAAGDTSQGTSAVAIGSSAGLSSQSANAVAIGTSAGSSTQRVDAVAIGNGAGSLTQGIAAVAIGALAGRTFQGNNSIIINATGANLDQTTANTFTVAPVRNDVANVAQVMFYNTTSKEITYGNVISVAGNITGGNLTVGSGTITGGNVNGAIFNGNVAFGTGTVGGSGNIAGGNISATGNVTAGNIVTSGSGGDITMSGGNITGAGNITGGNILGNGASMTGVATKTTGTWTVTTGTNNYSFTVPANNTYQLWVNGNIPNGIIVYNATVSVSNTNVPVIGQQFAWNYEGAGNPILLTSIPAQIIGTAGAISNATVAVGNTTNTFTFGINNSSGNTVTVNYGYTKIS